MSPCCTPTTWCASAIDRLIAETEDDLASVRSLSGDERDQVIADFAETLESLHSTAARLRPPEPGPAPVERSPHVDEHERRPADRHHR